MSRNGLSNASYEPLPNREYQPLHAPTQRLEDAAIVSEISARMMEWRSAHLVESKPIEWLLRIAMLAQDNPDALWLYLSLQSGDLSTLTQTFQELADARSMRRQTMHTRHQEAIASMALHFPELKSVITEMDTLFRPARGINGASKFMGPSQHVVA